MLGVRDDGGPGLGASFVHVQHLVNLASDRAIFLEVPQLVGATMGLKNGHTAGILVHIQHQSGHTKISHFKIFTVLRNVNQFALSHWFSY